VTLLRRVVAEGVGTALLLAAVVGSGIMGERLAGGNVALALLANTLATGAALVALILCFGSVSGAHFNPAVTLVEAGLNSHPWGELLPYVLAQLGGAFLGVALAHALFGEALFSASTRPRAGFGLLLSEAVATFGLIVVIRGAARRPQSVPFAVGTYITAAYWFTASTSFANPAVTLARTTTGSFVGIRLVDPPGFVAAELVGAGAAAGLARGLFGSRKRG
jgi:glycerol uptake facilitator-like aquaporin